MPSFIRDQSDFARLVQIGTTPESVTLEFKKDFGARNIPKGTQERDEKRREASKETARDIAQFANTLGGILLLGVDETKDSATGMGVASATWPLRDVDDLRRWVDEAVTRFVVPSTISYEWVVLPQPGGGAIVAINVPGSAHLVTVWDREQHTSEHLRRTHQGKAWMNPDEMERHLMNSSRAAYLKLQSLMERCPSGEASIADGHWIQHGVEPPERWNPVGPVKLQLTDSESFLLTVPSNNGLHAVPGPYEVIEGVWLGVDGKINILLTKRLLFRGGIIGLARIG